jgi:hypothetical protein
MQKVEIDVVPAPQTHKEIHIALAFDGTLAHYDKWQGQYNKVGAPIPLMVSQVKDWLKRGYKVSIFTARLSHSNLES